VYINEFLTDIDDKNHKAIEDDTTGFKVDLVCELYFQKSFETLVTTDTAWSIFSVFFVFFYLMYHLKSLFLATVGIWLIMLSFPMTVCITEGIL
jgi:hypothetical protein